MILDGAPAHAAQLAELLEGVLKLGGHLDGPPKDVAALIAAASSVVATDPQSQPVIIVTLDGGTIVETYGTRPTRVIFLDADTEGGDKSQVVKVLGEPQYVTEKMAEVWPDSVRLVLKDLAAHVSAEEDDEGEPEAPRP